MRLIGFVRCIACRCICSVTKQGMGLLFKGERQRSESEWMDGWMESGMDRWVGGLMDGRLDDGKDGLVDGCMGGWMDGRKREKTNAPRAYDVGGCW